MVAIAAGLCVGHWRTWQQVRTQPLTALERDYRRRQVRRRLQTSSMLGLLALAMFVGQFLPAGRSPLVFTVFWLGVVGLVLWIVLLAAADAIATHRYAQKELERRLFDEVRRALADSRRRPSDEHPGNPPHDSDLGDVGPRNSDLGPREE